MTIQEAKDQAARERGYDQFESVIDAQNISSAYDDDFKEIINRSLEIFAEAKAKEATSLDDTKIKYYEDKIEMLIRTSAELEKEAYNQGVRDAAESAEIELPNGLLCKIISTIDVNGEEFEFNICINKQSILKLLK